MSYRLRTDEPIASGIRRIAREQLEGALCRDRPVTAGKEAAAVHATRKHIKKNRALLRLIREEIGQEIFEEENRKFAGRGARFLGSRDARVQLQLLEKLRRQAHLDSAAFSKNQLGAGEGNGDTCRSASARATRGEKQLCSRSAIGSKAGRWMILGWTIFVARCDVRIGAAEKLVAALARKRPPENFHAWRRRVKEVWYQARLSAMSQSDCDVRDHEAARPSARSWATSTTSRFSDNRLEAERGLSTKRNASCCSGSSARASQSWKQIAARSWRALLRRKAPSV